MEVKAVVKKRKINPRNLSILGRSRNIIELVYAWKIGSSFQSSRFFDAILSPNIFAFAFKCSLLLLAISICCLQPSSANVFFSEEQLKTAVPVEFAAKNKALLVIVIPQNPKDIEKQAADLLAKYLGEITGAKFDIVAGDVPQTQHIISLGRTEAAKKAGFTDEQMRCPDQGYKIFVKDGSIYIFGGEKMGTCYAASSLLEEDLGVRLYTDKWSVIPHNINLTAPIVQRAEQPDFEKRLLLTYKDITDNWVWSHFNRVMANNGYDHVSGWFAHTYDTIIPREDFSRHPDFFAKDASGKASPLQLCPSNHEVEKIATEKMLVALKNNHAKGTLISLSQNDTRFLCQCPTCLKLQKKYDTPMGAHLELVNKVAAAIGKTYPDVTIDFLVYTDWFRKSPNNNIEMEKNTAFWYCVEPPVQGFFSKNKAFVKEFEQWQKIVPQAYIWDYNTNFEDYARTLPALPAKAANLKFWKEHGVKGVFMLDAYTDDTGWAPMQTLRSWVLNKLLWNCSLDYDELAKDFCYGVFGKCGTEAYEYYKLAENPGISGKTIEECSLQKYFDQSNKIITRAYAKAEGDEELTKRLNLYFFGVLFAQLEDIYNAYPKNKATFPTKRYCELYTKVTEIAKQWKINSYNEAVCMEGKLNEMAMLLNPTMDGSLKTSARYGTIYKGMLREDPLLNNQLVGKLPPDGDWLVQWHYPGRLLMPGKKYQLRVELRLEDESKGKRLGYFQAGIFPLMDSKIELSDISLKKYKYFNVGKPIIPEEKGYVWFALSNGSNQSGVYVNRIELIPVE